MHLLSGLTPNELAGFVLFVGSLTLVYLYSAGILIESLIRKLKGLKMSFSPRLVLLRRITLTLAIAGLACIAYGYFVEPYNLSVERATITTSKLPPGTGPIRIVQISDLHCDPMIRLEDRLPAVIAEQKPDAIVFTGDALNSQPGYPILRRCLTRLGRIAPTYAVRGNWDVLYWGQLDLFGQPGVKELNGESVPVTAKGATIWVAGASVGPFELKEKALAMVPPGAFVVFLYHYPSAVVDLAQRQVDLVLAGHTHGGQVALPLYGALITLSKLGKQYESGLYRRGDTWLYVNRGIGMEGGWAPRVRFCARPEVTVIDIVPAAPALKP